MIWSTSILNRIFFDLSFFFGVYFAPTFVDVSTSWLKFDKTWFYKLAETKHHGVLFVPTCKAILFENLLLERKIFQKWFLRENDFAWLVQLMPICTRMEKSWHKFDQPLKKTLSFYEKWLIKKHGFIS